MDCVRYLYTRKQQFMLCLALFVCAEDCIMYVHARKGQFVLDRELCSCAEEYFIMYVYTREHLFFVSVKFMSVHRRLCSVGPFSEMPVYALPEVQEYAQWT